MIAKKLNLKPGMRVAIAKAPAGFKLDEPAGVTIEKSLTQNLDLVLFFATSQKELKAHWPSSWRQRSGRALCGSHIRRKAPESSPI